VTDEIRTTSPVAAAGGFAGRAPTQPHPRGPGKEDASGGRASDRVSVDRDVEHAMRLLRERVLARTRALLGVPEGMNTPEFAEVVEGEPIETFLGRLLSAQNQLTARRAGTWTPEGVRRACHKALEQGVAETLELLTADGRSAHQGIGAVGEVLVAYGRRLREAALAAEPEPQHDVDSA